MAGISAKLGGFPLLGTSDVSWSLQEGTRPVIKSFDMIPEHAVTLARSRTPISLEIDDNLKVEKLYVLDAVAGENKHIRRVRVTDRRYWWTYKHIRKYFNVRRNVGFKRITDLATPPEAASVIPSVWYAPWSLKDPTPGADPASAKWTVETALKAIIEELQEPESELGRGGFPYNIADLARFRRLPIENLLIDDAGDQALSRILTYMPEAGVYVDYDGTVRFFSKVDGNEKNQIALAQPYMVGEGDVQFVDNANVRPRKIVFLYTYESEMRIDHEEAGTVTRTNDDFYMQNVMPLPDYSLEVNGKTEVQGTWLPITTLLTAWGAPPGFDRPLTYDDIQKAMVPFMDLWAGIEISGKFDPDADWATRIAYLKVHWRRTYRVQRFLMDRIHQLKPYRLGTVDQATGFRAPAICYSDYCYLPSQRSLLIQARGGGGSADLSYFINVKGYPKDDTIVPASKGAPATVSILDPDQGIIHVSYQVDPTRVFEQILPGLGTMSQDESNVDADGLPLIAGPTGNLLTARSARRGISFDALGKSHVNNIPKLHSTFKASVILTAIPGSPNDNRALYPVEVKPSDVADLLPAFARSSLNSAEGPTLEVRIGPGVETARIPWLDSRSDDIKALFGVPDLGGGQPNVKDLVLNDSDATSEAGASLRQISLAGAARLYASLTDRFEGDAAGNMTDAIRPGGWLTEVEHTLKTDGVKMTRVSLPDRVQPLDIFAFMDSSTRAMILRLASPDNTV